MIIKNLKQASVSTILALLLGSGHAGAGTATDRSSSWFWGTKAGITGDGWDPSGTVNITYTLADGSTVPATASANALGHLEVNNPANVPVGTPWTLTGKEKDETTGTAKGKTVAMLTPGENALVSVCVANANSSVSVGGNSYTVSGQFTAVTTGWDSDPNSPTYGNMSSMVLRSGFSLAVPALGLSITLPTDWAFGFNVAAVDAAIASQGSDFVSAQTAIPLSPTAISLQIGSGGQSYTASGTVTGTGTAAIGDQDSGTFDASLSNAQLGNMGLHLDMSIADSLVSIPEPSVLALLAVGGLVLLGCRSRRAKA